jgi:spore coat protein U-like protein
MNAIINLDGGVGNLPDSVTVGVGQTVMLTRKLSEPGVALRFHYHGTDAEQIRFFLYQNEAATAPAGFRAALLVKTLRAGTGEIIVSYRPHNPVIDSYEKTIAVVSAYDAD